MASYLSSTPLSYAKSFWSGIKDVPYRLKNTLINKVKSKTQEQIEEFVDITLSPKINAYAESKLHDFFYKNNDLIGKVKSSGEEVVIYNQNIHLISRIFKKVTAIDLERDIPLLPGSVTGLALKNMDSLLISGVPKVLHDALSLYLNDGKILSLTSQATKLALYKSVGIAQSFIEQSFIDIECEIDDIVNDFSTEEDRNNITKMKDHYLAQAKIILNEGIRSVVTQASKEYLSELTDYIEGQAESGISIIGSLGLVAGTTVINPIIGSVVGSALIVDKFLDTESNPGCITQLSQYTLKTFFNKEAQKESANKVIEVNAAEAIQRLTPQSIAVNAQDIENAHGKCRISSDDEELDYLLIEKEDPWSLTKEFKDTRILKEVAVKPTIKVLNSLEILLTGREVLSKVDMPDFADLTWQDIIINNNSSEFCSIQSNTFLAGDENIPSSDWGECAHPN